MVKTLAFDVFGTLIDPGGMEMHLRPFFGDAAKRAAVSWRAKQLDFAIRRALMRRYMDFDICTEEALAAAGRELGVELSAVQQRALLDRYVDLPAFPDALPGLRALQRQGHTLVAFSNGTARTLATLFGRAGLRGCFADTISVDEVKSFKPDPTVYEHLVRRVGREKDAVWLISSNPFDVAGAKSCGLRAAWVRRDPGRIFDGWEFSPDLVVRDLEDLAKAWEAADASA